MHENQLFIINSDILPNIYQKVIIAKRLLRSGESLTIQEACRKSNLSRSAFYKYKDKVFDYSSKEKGRLLTLFMLLRHAPGILSDILNSIAAIKGNIITISQNIPIMDTASVTITIDTNTMDISPDELLVLLHEAKGCKKAEIIGME